MSLIEKLPKVKGSYRENFDLSKVVWFQAGGKAEVLFKPADIEDLQHFLKNKPADIPVTVIGVGSNLLVRDGGVKGVVVRLGGPFAEIKILPSSRGLDESESKDSGTSITARDLNTTQDSGQLRLPAKSEILGKQVPGITMIKTGAAALSPNVAKFAEINSVAGLEFLCGIPGSIGGALAMNAGSYGSEIKDIFISAKAIDEKGNLHNLSATDIKFKYRGNSVPQSWIFVEAIFQGRKSNVQEISVKMNEISSKREETQPIRSRTGGSTFANPDPVQSNGKKAWQLIDEAGCRGFKIGGAQISEKHCNFMINTGNATASELENLGEEVRKKVMEKSGINLRWEIRMIGDNIKK